MENKVLIIAGMHRSGTSLITHWLQECGLEIGERLLGPAYSNVDGHFEDVEFHRMHAEILTDNGLMDDGLIDTSVGDMTSYHKEKIKSIVEVKNQQFNEWGWKDPRTCLFLDFYKKLLPDANYLVIFRDFKSVVISLLKRHFAEFDIYYKNNKGYLSRLNWQKIKRKRKFEQFCQQHTEEFLRVWIYYNQRILDTINSLSDDKYLVLNYNVLQTKDAEVIDYLNSHWHFSLHYSQFNNIYKPALFSKSFDIENYISDRGLIQQALELEKLLNPVSYSGNVKNQMLKVETLMAS